MKLGFLGIGLMGRPMAERLLEAGHEVCAWSRSRAKAERLVPRGARLAADPAEAFAFGEASVLMLTDGDAVAAVLEEAGDLRGRTVLQMSTIAPGESVGFARLLADAGGGYLEAPVLGSTPQAEEGKLIVMAGGARDTFERWTPVLSVFGPDPRYLGEVGKAAAAKLALNQLIGSLTAAYAYSLGLVRRHDVDLDTFLGILRESALYAPTVDKKLPRILARDFADPNFPLKHLHKDMRLARAEGRHLGMAVDVVEAVAALLQEGERQGLADLDYSALAEVIAPPDSE